MVHATETFASKVVLSHVLGIGGRLALSTKEEDFVLNNNQLETCIFFIYSFVYSLIILMLYCLF